MSDFGKRFALPEQDMAERLGLSATPRKNKKRWWRLKRTWIGVGVVVLAPPAGGFPAAIRNSPISPSRSPRAR